MHDVNRIMGVLGGVISKALFLASLWAALVMRDLPLACYLLGLQITGKVGHVRYLIKPDAVD
jgi:hypothetical protein